ncbi:hypothetical protein [Parasediminibacterium sp. JCM 36343]|uniref:hypothetical protein n=1 Tax=Parasediminibacterium sp. JCM 36343 TaxID=3374279 RepID=UPI00397D852B
MKKYYLHEQGQQKGPYSLKELGAKAVARWMYSSVIIAMLSITVVPYLLYKNYKLGIALGLAKQEVLTTRAQAVNIQEGLQIQNDELRSLNRGSKVVADGITIKQMEYRNNWKKYIRSSVPTYSVGFFGGVSGVSIKISDSTQYPIDEIDVEVKYILKKGGVYKTEIVTVTNLLPFSERKITLPNSKRGRTVVVGFRNIRAKAYRFCYNSRIEVTGTDPWLCD